VSEENLSILSLILNASVLVQLVMVVLFVASVISWIMIVQRGIYLRNAENSFKHFEDTFWSGVDLNNLYHELSQEAQENGGNQGIENVFRAGFREFTRLTDGQSADPDAVMEGTDRAYACSAFQRGRSAEYQSPIFGQRCISQPLHRLVWYRMGNHEFL
jgi:biopolymer transport protein TolQ